MADWRESTSLDISDEHIPEYVRYCWESYQSATKDLREASEYGRKMWLGGKHQWRDGEIASRESTNRPYISINCIRPAVAQVENEARSNPPGPEAVPVGVGSDPDDADIWEGLVREYEYRSSAIDSYILALRNALAGNYGVFQIGTEYAEDGSFDQRLIVKPVHDPDCCFVDPNDRSMNRENAMWGGEIRVLSREQVISEFGDKLKILNKSFTQRASGWMQNVFGWYGDQGTVNLWTGGWGARGPYYVAEFYRIVSKRVKLIAYDDHINRLQGDPVPDGVNPEIDEDGEIVFRWQSEKTVMKYVCTALDIIKKTEWIGTQIPYFWILGPEMYIKGKLFRLGLCDGAHDSQRGLNYTATCAAEIVGGMTKAPFIGPQGAFDVQNAQGVNPWESSNTTMWAYMEYKPVFAVNPTTKLAEMAPPPSRNTWEAPIARLLELSTFFRESIKAATSIFFDPTQQSVRDVQSGEAIRALQSQTNIGTFDWQKALLRAIGLSYAQAAIILPKILSGTRVQTIVRADSRHELTEINRNFDTGWVDPATGKPGKRRSIEFGKFSLRATAGPSFLTRKKEAIADMSDFFKGFPQGLAIAGVAGGYLRMLGEGNPEVEHMADLLSPSQDGEMSPQQMQATVAKLQQQNQMLTAVSRKMQQVLQSRLPEIEAEKYTALLDSITKIRVAEISASKDLDKAGGDRLADLVEHLTGMAHDTAQAHVQRQHDVSQAQIAQQAAQQQEAAAEQPQGATQ